MTANNSTMREFWIHTSANGEGRAYKDPCASFSEKEVHVIEYSALLEERAKSARLLEALNLVKERLKRISFPYQVSNNLLWEITDKIQEANQAINVVDEAIRDYNQSEGGE